VCKTAGRARTGVGRARTHARRARTHERKACTPGDRVHTPMGRMRMLVSVVHKPLDRAHKLVGRAGTPVDRACALVGRRTRLGGRTPMGRYVCLWGGHTFGWRGRAWRWGACTRVGRVLTVVRERARVVEGAQKGKASRCKRNFLFTYPPSKYNTL
jgi:hypothetical protein